MDFSLRLEVVSSVRTCVRKCVLAFYHCLGNDVQNSMLMQAV